MLQQDETINSISLFAENYQYQIYNSVLQISEEEWGKIVDSSTDLAMDQRLIHLMETTLANQAKFWTIVIRDLTDEPVCFVLLSLFYADIVQSSPFFLRKLINKIRVKWPTAFKWPILFCGLPIPAGHSHIRFSPGVMPRKILDLINNIMQQLAKQHGAYLIVFKELNTAQAEKISYIRTLGFQQGELAPLFFLQRQFENFSDYLSALRSGYRHQIKLNLKKFTLPNLRVEHTVIPEQIKIQFTEDVYQLYLNVWEKAKEKLECLTIDFFRELPIVMATQIIFTLITSNNKPIAFSMGIQTKSNYYNLYTGMDYSLNEKIDLYFNLFYHEIGNAFTLKKECIFLGQTSDSFKSRLGAVVDPKFFFVRAVNPIFNKLLTLFRFFIFPKYPENKKNKVFK